MTLEDAAAAGGRRAGASCRRCRRAPCSRCGCRRQRRRRRGCPPALRVASENGPAPVRGRRARRTRSRRSQRSSRPRASRAARLQTSHAFHSPMMDPVVEPFDRARARRRSSAPPRIPFVSTVTGTWITRRARRRDPAYWARPPARARCASRAGVATLLAGEPGARAPRGRTARHARDARAAPVEGPLAAASRGLAGRRASADRRSAAMLAAAGQLWRRACASTGRGLHGGEPRRRVALPTYPFERKRYWVEPATDRRTGAPGRRAR